MGREVIAGAHCCETVTWDHTNAKMTQDATMTSDNIGERMTKTSVGLTTRQTSWSSMAAKNWINKKEKLIA
jgi:hypothetical protein